MVESSNFWYDRNSLFGKTVKKTKEELEEKPRQSCPTCGNPVFERIIDKEGKEKKMVCEKYPNCKPKNRYSDYSDDDDYYY